MSTAGKPEHVGTQNENCTGRPACLFSHQVLKFVINQARPDGAEKIDPGMPSTHAVTLSFLSTYVALCLLSGCRKTLARHGSAGALVTAAVLLVRTAVDHIKNLEYTSEGKCIFGFALRFRVARTVMDNGQMM
jgi:hypothetical protein